VCAQNIVKRKRQQYMNEIGAIHFF